MPSHTIDGRLDCNIFLGRIYSTSFLLAVFFFGKVGQMRIGDANGYVFVLSVCISVLFLFGLFMVSQVVNRKMRLYDSVCSL